MNAKAKKSLTFIELVSELPDNKEETIEEESWEDEHLFLISTIDPWHGTLITYLQTQRIDAQYSSMNDAASDTRHGGTSLLGILYTIEEYTSF